MATSDDQPKKYGVAFSGGGIRSAAFCSGVLRRLVQLSGVELNYLSCVSGGGYTGTAYLDWKYRNKGSDEFFNNMRSRSGYICNWQKPLHGLVDTAVFILLTLFVNFCIPVIGWGSFACPLALFIDEAFGKYLNGARFRCDESREEACEFPVNSLAFTRMWIFLATLAGFVSFYLLEKCIPKQVSSCRTCVVILRDLLHFFEVLGGLLFAFTFLPWFINDYFENAPTWVELGIVFLSGAVWFFFPILRSYSSLVILIYCYSYVIYWHVYDETLLTIQHTDQWFHKLLYISLIILGVASFTGDVQLHLVHIYNRWRLQKAFYTEKSVGKIGCAGISFYDFFPGSYCFTPGKVQENTNPENTNSEPLSLSHLKDIKPQYISNITVNGWRNDKDSKLNCRLLTISPKSIGVIDKQPQQQQQNDLEQNDVLVQIEPSLHDTKFDNKLEPGDIKLSSAMAMSAAAVSPYLGKFVEEEQAFRHIFSIIGLDMAASIVFNMAGERNAGRCKKISHWLMRIVFMVMLIFFPILYFCGAIGDSVWYPTAVAIFFGFMVVLSICMSHFKSLSRFFRWLHVHVPFFRFMWGIINVVITGPEPPAMLHLSDGGHFENLGILPLFKLRLKKIVAVYGGEIKSDSCYAKELIYALTLAREILNCSFIATNGDDFLKDIEENFLKSDENGKYPRKYEFKVHYYEGTGVERKKVGEGDVVFITPRHPKKGLEFDIESEAKGWVGEGWKVAATPESDDVDRLIFCCCECCNNSCGCCSGTCCPISSCEFPHHTTANQFFTPKMFSVYHKEGYRACMEANAFFEAQPDTEEGEESVEEERKGGRGSEGKGKGGEKERAEREGEEGKRRKGEGRPEEAEKLIADGEEGGNERAVEEWEMKATKYARKPKIV